MTKKESWNKMPVKAKVALVILTPLAWIYIVIYNTCELISSTAYWWTETGK